MLSTAPKRPPPNLEDLRRRYQEYGVQPQHYQVLREALLWSMGHMLGDDFDEDIAAAWCATYTTAAHAL